MSTCRYMHEGLCKTRTFLHVHASFVYVHVDDVLRRFKVGILWNLHRIDTSLHKFSARNNTSNKQDNSFQYMQEE